MVADGRSALVLYHHCYARKTSKSRSHICRYHNEKVHASHLSDSFVTLCVEIFH
jgi:hypothetical protein